MYVNRQYNYFTPTDGTAATTRLNLRRRGVIIARGNFASSSYNSLQAELSRSFVRGITFRAAYTYSKDLDDASEIFNTFLSPPLPGRSLSQCGLKKDGDNSAWDHRNYIVLSYVWAPKGYTASNAIENGLLGSIHTPLDDLWRRAVPVRAYSTLNESGFDANGDGAPQTIVRSSATQGSVQHRGDRFFFNWRDPRHLLQPQYLQQPRYLQTESRRRPEYRSLPGAEGTSTSSLKRLAAILSQPGYQQHDLAIEKGIGLSYLHFERGTINLRAEANNVGNHNNVNPLGVTNVSRLRCEFTAQSSSLAHRSRTFDGSLGNSEVLVQRAFIQEGKCSD